jgi:hypothetical protein
VCDQIKSKVHILASTIYTAQWNLGKAYQSQWDSFSVRWRFSHVVIEGYQNVKKWPNTALTLLAEV